MHIYPRLCADRPDECDHIPAVVQRFPRRQESAEQRQPPARRSVRPAVPEPVQLVPVATARLGEHVLRAEGQLLLRSRTSAACPAPGDMVTEYNGNVPAQRTTYFSNDPRLEPARYGWSITSTTASRHTATVSDSWRPTRYLTVTPALSHIWAQRQQQPRPPDPSARAPSPRPPRWPGTSPTTAAPCCAAATTSTSIWTWRCWPGTRWAGMTQQRCDWNRCHRGLRRQLRIQRRGQPEHVRAALRAHRLRRPGAQLPGEAAASPARTNTPSAPSGSWCRAWPWALDLFHRTFRRPYELRETNRIWAERRIAGVHRRLPQRPPRDHPRPRHPDGSRPAVPGGHALGQQARGAAEAQGLVYAQRSGGQRVRRHQQRLGRHRPPRRLPVRRPARRPPPRDEAEQHRSRSRGWLSAGAALPLLLRPTLQPALPQRPHRQTTISTGRGWARPRAPTSTTRTTTARCGCRTCRI